MAVVWLYDDLIKNSGSYTQLEYRKSDNDSQVILVGSSNSNGLPKFEIEHSYGDKEIKTLATRMLDAVKEFRSSYADAEAQLFMTRQIIKGMDSELANTGIDKLSSAVKTVKDLTIGASQNEKSYHTAEEQIRFWKDTKCKVTIPTFESVLIPKVSPNGRIQSTTDQLEEVLHYFIGKFEKVGSIKNALGSIYEGIQADLGDWPWYSYSAPNGYSPESVKYGNNIYLNNSFSLVFRDQYKIENLLINNVGIESSKTLIVDPNGVKYPSSIKLTINFKTGVEYTMGMLCSMLGISDSKVQ